VSGYACHFYYFFFFCFSDATWQANGEGLPSLCFLERELGGVQPSPLVSMQTGRDTPSLRVFEANGEGRLFPLPFSTRMGKGLTPLLDLMQARRDTPSPRVFETNGEGRALTIFNKNRGGHEPSRWFRRKREGFDPSPRVFDANREGRAIPFPF